MREDAAKGLLKVKIQCPWWLVLWSNMHNGFDLSEGVAIVVAMVVEDGEYRQYLLRKWRRKWRRWRRKWRRLLPTLMIQMRS